MGSPPRSKPTRRWRIGVVLAIVALGVLASLVSVPGHQQVVLLDQLAASDAAAAVRYLPPLRPRPAGPCDRIESEYEAGNDLLKGRRVGFYARAWPSYQALQALYIASLSPGARSCRADLTDNMRALDAHYWDDTYASPAAFDQGPHAFHLPWDAPRVDDSLWLGLAATRAYTLTHDRAFLERAEAVFRLAVGNWDPRKGGVYWEYHTSGATNHDKTVVSNAPAALLGAALYSQTGDQIYLAWSERMVDWAEANLLDAQTGLYNDHVDDDARPASVGTAKFTYNQGVMVGAIAALSVLDPGRYRLSDAVDLARRSMSYFAAHHAYGQPSFDAIWADNLLATAGLYRNAAFTNEARSAVELALKAEPGGGSLIADGSDTALTELAHLSANRYLQLSYVSSGPVPRSVSQAG
ncbi:MAG TPA: glycoside hydrolase family 76 protein [Acidimicrobiales bacterium]|nr:glycoside hydrolase family 76 protein [Acidimicrobiales bacterium]